MSEKILLFDQSNKIQLIIHYYNSPLKLNSGQLYQKIERVNLINLIRNVGVFKDQKITLFKHFNLHEKPNNPFILISKRVLLSVIKIINNFISMRTQIHKKIRAVSARPPQARPYSGKAKNNHQKTEFNQNISAFPHPKFHSFQKNKMFSMRSNMPETEPDDVSKLVPKADKMMKEREQLFEENLHLRQQINKLKDQLAKNKTKIENLSSKNHRYTKQFNREFQKKMYWNGSNSYLISGIKAQYEKLKEQYYQKQLQCNILRRQLTESGAPEFKIYSQLLLEDNKKLLQKINQMSEISSQILLDSDGQNIVPEYKYHELVQKNERILQKLHDNQLTIKTSKEQNRQQRRKIEFLQKLIIEKDNSQYHAHKKGKKLEREKNEVVLKNKQLEEAMEQANRIWEQRFQKLRNTEIKKFESERSIFQKTLNQKQQKIKSMEKEVAYLSTLLSYWKPLDQFGKQMGNKMEQSRANIGNQSESSEPEKLQYTKNYLSPSVPVSKKRKPSENLSQSFRGGDFLMNISKQLENSDENKKNRVQQTADQRHSQNAEKKRKVDIREVEHLGQHLRYRLLGLKLSVRECRNYFDYSENIKQGSFISVHEDLEWAKQYITMEETQKILMNYPFQLNEQDAYELARYLVEDSDKQYVYCDLKNENTRNIVKSIIRSLIGDYEILNGARQETIEKQCEVMMERYSNNLISALSSMASSGFISRKKFIQLINSLGIQLSEEGRDYLICKMLLKSASLEALNYTVLF